MTPRTVWALPECLQETHTLMNRSPRLLFQTPFKALQESLTVLFVEASAVAEFCQIRAEIQVFEGVGRHPLRRK